MWLGEVSLLNLEKCQNQDLGETAFIFFLTPSEKTFMSPIASYVTSLQRKMEYYHISPCIDILRLGSIWMMTEQMNGKSGLKIWDFFFAWYSLDIISKSLRCSLELRETLLKF